MQGESLRPGPPKRRPLVQVSPCFPSRAHRTLLSGRLSSLVARQRALNFLDNSFFPAKPLMILSSGNLLLVTPTAFSSSGPNAMYQSGGVSEMISSCASSEGPGAREGIFDAPGAERGPACEQVRFRMSYYCIPTFLL